MTQQYDVVVVGGSLAGCAAAVLYARAGLKVALVERNPNPKAYKKVCTHFIQPAATPTLQRLGLEPSLARAGALKNSLQLYTRYGRFSLDSHRADGTRAYGYSVRREKLDPLVRDMALATPNLDVRLGRSLRELIRDASGRVVGVRVEGAGGESETLAASLVVGADGRGSRVAQLAQSPARVTPHGRFGYLRYYRGLAANDDPARFWLMEPNAAYVFPNDDGVTAVACFIRKEELPAYKANLEERFIQLFEGLDDGPRLREATPVSDFIGMIDMPNAYRRPDTRPGLALVGDAALTSDPMWGVGCGWAFLSAEWLVEETAAAVRAGPRKLDAAVSRYARRHARTLLPIHRQNDAYSDAKRFPLGLRLAFEAAPHDEKLRALLARQPSLAVGPVAFVVQLLTRYIWLKLTGKLRAAADALAAQVVRRPTPTGP